MTALSLFEYDAETYTGCVTRSPKKVILHCFPAHVTDLQPAHIDEIDRIVARVRNGDITGRRIRKIRIEGHAATWRGLTAADYDRRSWDRARGARTYLKERLALQGLHVMPKITIKGFGDRRPLVDNRVSSVSAAARRNREINRRVEIFLDGAKASPKRPKKKDKPVQTDWDAFLDTKLRQLRDHWDIQRPFSEDNIKSCTLNKMLRPNARTVVVGFMPPSNSIDADEPVKWIDLREELIKELKSGRARGEIKKFEFFFDGAAMEMWDNVRRLGLYATGLELYNTRLQAGWKRATKLSKDKRHPYSCRALREQIEAANSKGIF